MLLSCIIKSLKITNRKARIPQTYTKLILKDDYILGQTDEPVVDEPTEDVPATPVTSDAGIVAAAAVMAVAAGIVLSKKH